MSEQKTLIKAMRDHFGYREGKDLKDFSQEFKALTEKDKEDFAGLFAQIGVEIVAMRDRDGADLLWRPAAK